MNDEAKAILALVPNAKFQQKPNGSLVWADTRTQPTEEQIQAKITELEAEEPLRQLRIQRNQLLQQTDWRMVSDYPGSNQSEWQTYRQALRDITTQTPSLDENGQLTGIMWPTRPAND